MCLIAYVPKGKALSRDVFDHANGINPDGIGVMSQLGVEKFFGSKQLKRARQYVDGLVKQDVAHAVHWRFATHGSRGLALCHPFKLPNAEAWLMHNGVIGATAQDARDDASDTLLYVNKLVDAPQTHEDIPFWNKVANDMGRQNKGIVMYPNGHYILLNQEDGVTIDDIWYSNQYSLPRSVRKDSYHFVPARLRPTGSWNGDQGGWGLPSSRYGGSGYFPSRLPDTNSYGNGPYGHMIYWSERFQSYGFWEANYFQKLIITRGDSVISTFSQTPVTTPAITVPVMTEEGLDPRKCPVCLRFKKDPPKGFLECYCTDMALASYYARQQSKVIAAEASTKPAMPSGPTTEPNPAPAENSAPAASSEACEHGETSWENCRKCIDELEMDSSSEVQRWLAARAGKNILYLPPRGKASEK